MAEKRYYWLKLQEDFFQSKRIKKLRSLAGGDTYTIIYLKMQLLSLSSGGLLEFTSLEKSFSEELALDIDESPDNVEKTVNYLMNVGLLETSNDKEYLMPFVVKNIGSEGSSAQRMRDLRQRKDDEKPLISSHSDNGMTTLCAKRYGEIDIEKDIDKDIKKEIHIEKEKVIIPYSTILEKYHSMCPSLPKVAKLTQQRKDAIKARFNEYNGQQTFEEVFKKVETSDFLTGRMEGRDFKASFDWIIKPSNFIKILEGNYDNRKSTKEDKDVGFDLDDFFNSATKRR